MKSNNEIKQLIEANFDNVKLNIGQCSPESLYASIFKLGCDANKTLLELNNKVMAVNLELDNATKTETIISLQISSKTIDNGVSANCTIYGKAIKNYEIVIDSKNLEVTAINVAKQEADTTTQVIATLQSDCSPALPPLKKSKSKEEEPVENLKKFALVVDDAVMDRATRKTLLTKLGYETHVANNGAAAIKAVKESYDKKVVYAYISMDQQMETNEAGFSATEAIRQFEKDKGIPAARIVGCSANAKAEDIKQWQKSGANAFLAKPIKTEHLRESLTGSNVFFINQPNKTIETSPSIGQENPDQLLKM